MKFFLTILFFVFLFSLSTGEDIHGINCSDIEIIFGNQIWTKKNFDFPMPKCWWYDNDSMQNNNYGRLYFFSSALAGAPKGWHLPTLEEWQVLINYFGGDSIAGKQLMNDTSDFNLPLAGHKSANITTNDLFDLKEQFGFYWTATEKAEQTAYAIQLRNGVPYVVKNYFRKANGFSVRYIKNKT
jgi:uncharacterized protein (TIGR02145 family)